MALLSVCIPAYNRPDFIDDLLQSIVEQEFEDYEIVVSEDNSPRTSEVEEVVRKYQVKHPTIPIRFDRNEKTLGYDGNFRALLGKARGEYCIYMGDDDLLCQDALKKIAAAVRHYPDVGVLLRSWVRVERDTCKPLELHRYFDSDRFFPKGPESIATLFRRSVSIAGYTINRKAALEFSTDRFDGTLLYQLYLTGMVLNKYNAVYLSDVIAHMRKADGPTHFFGTAEAEKGKFTPQKLQPDNSIHFMNGMLEIAEYLESEAGIKGIFKPIVKDIGNYSYPILMLHADKKRLEFLRYSYKLAKMGLGRSKLFYIYTFALFFLGKRSCDYIIRYVKRRLNYTPRLGGLYAGTEAHGARGSMK